MVYGAILSLEPHQWLLVPCLLTSGSSYMKSTSESICVYVCVHLHVRVCMWGAGRETETEICPCVHVQRAKDQHWVFFFLYYFPPF